MTTRHTPGPWRLLNQCGVLAIHKGAKPVIAWPGFDSADVGGHAVNLANATLIAAAPALADALEKAADTLRDASAAYHFFGKHVAAEAMDIAEKHCREVLRAAGRLPDEPRAAPSAAVETREGEE